MSFDLVRKPADLFLVLDRSASMLDDNAGNSLPANSPLSKWAQVVPAVTTAVTQTNTDVSWGLKMFPEGTFAECTADSLTTKIDVPVAALTPRHRRGGPEHGLERHADGAAINIAFNYLKNLNDNANRYILPPPTEPSCTASLSKDTTQARGRGRAVAAPRWAGSRPSSSAWRPIRLTTR